jgi:hypothetical protein
VGSTRLVDHKQKFGEGFFVAFLGRGSDLLTSLSKAGSWALWNGIFNKYWLQILSAGGLSHSEAMVLTKQLSEVIADYRARIHCARFSKDKAVEAEKQKPHQVLADKYINEHYKCKYNGLLEDIIYTAHSHNKAYFFIERHSPQGKMDRMAYTSGQSCPNQSKQ